MARCEHNVAVRHPDSLLLVEVRVGCGLQLPGRGSTARSSFSSVQRRRYIPYSTPRLASSILPRTTPTSPTTSCSYANIARPKPLSAEHLNLMNDTSRRFHATMQDLVRASDERVKESRAKMLEMLAVDLDRRSVGRETPARKRAEDTLAAFHHKRLLSALALEQLWRLSECSRASIFETLQASLDRFTPSDGELVALAFSLEAFLIQSRASIEFYWVHVCEALGIATRSYLKPSQFRKRLAEIESPELRARGRRVRARFDRLEDPPASAGIESAWLKMLTSLRDKVAHRDQVRPNFESTEMIADQVLHDWPTIKTLTWERFGQAISNGIFEDVIREGAPELYDVPWQAGPYRPGMFAVSDD